MAVTMESRGIDRVPLADREAVSLEIIDNIYAEPHRELRPGMSETPDRRMAAFEANPEDSYSVDEAFAKIRQRLGK